MGTNHARNEMSQPMQLLTSHSTVEWYTPPAYIEAARRVMGCIDLDPASCTEAQKIVQARVYFTKETDGLSQDWFGNVWLNPPYSKVGNRSSQDIWAQYLINQYQTGNVTQAILLVKAALGYNWFENLWCDWPVVLARKRISFIRSDGTTSGQSKQARAFFYFGPNLSAFVDMFSRIGRYIPSGR